MRITKIVREETVPPVGYFAAELTEDHVLRRLNEKAVVYEYQPTA